MQSVICLWNSHCTAQMAEWTKGTVEEEQASPLWAQIFCLVSLKLCHSCSGITTTNKRRWSEDQASNLPIWKVPVTFQLASSDRDSVVVIAVQSQVGFKCVDGSLHTWRELQYEAQPSRGRGEVTTPHSSNLNPSVDFCRQLVPQYVAWQLI